MSNSEAVVRQQLEACDTRDPAGFLAVYSDAIRASRLPARWPRPA
jgi:hypothetical protein